MHVLCTSILYLTVLFGLILLLLYLFFFGTAPNLFLAGMGPSRSFTGRFVDCVAVDVGCLIGGVMRVRTVACEVVGCLIVGIMCAESAAAGVCVVIVTVRSSGTVLVCGLNVVCVVIVRSSEAVHGFTVVCVIVGVVFCVHEVLDFVCDC